MKLLRTDKAGFIFQLNSGERAALLEVLRRYPCVSPTHHRLTHKSTADSEAEKQRLLDEAVAEQRAQNQRQLQALLQRPETFLRGQHHWRFTLRHGDFEWFLQVLNDVRVGSWLALGSPEELPRGMPTDPDRAMHVLGMELAGLFQMTLLEAVASNTGI